MGKKIVIESLYLYNYNKPESGITVGGTQRYALDLGKLFYKNEYEVFYVTKANANSDIMYEDWARIVAFNTPYGEKGRKGDLFPLIRYLNNTLCEIGNKIQKVFKRQGKRTV